MCAQFHCNSSRTVEVILSTNCDTNQQACKDLSGDSYIGPSNFSSWGYNLALKQYPFYQLPAQQKVWPTKERAVSLKMEWLVHSRDWWQQHDSLLGSVFISSSEQNVFNTMPLARQPGQLNECVWSKKSAIQIYWMTNQTTHSGPPVQLSFHTSAKWLFQRVVHCCFFYWALFW